MDLKSLIEQKFKFIRPFVSGDVATRRVPPPLVPIAVIRCDTLADNVDITIKCNGLAVAAGNNAISGYTAPLSAGEWVATAVVERFRNQYERPRTVSFTDSTPDPDTVTTVAGMEYPAVPDIVLTQFVMATPDAICHSVVVKSVSVVQPVSGADLVPTAAYLQIVLHLSNEGSGTYTGDIIVYAA